MNHIPFGTDNMPGIPRAAASPPGRRQILRGMPGGIVGGRG